MSSKSTSTYRSYKWALGKGLLLRMHTYILDALIKHGPMNQTMTHRVVCRRLHRRLRDRAVGERFKELLKLGLIHREGRAPCPITGRLTTFFNVVS